MAGEQGGEVAQNGVDALRAEAGLPPLLEGEAEPSTEKGTTIPFLLQLMHC